MAKIDDLGDGSALGDLGGGVHIDDLGGGANLGDIGESTPISYFVKLDCQDNDSTDVVVDTSGNANDGTINGGTTESLSVAGPGDHVADSLPDSPFLKALNCKSGCGISLGALSDLNGATSYSVGGWARATGFGGTGWSADPVLAFFTDNSSGDGDRLGFYANENSGGNGVRVERNGSVILNTSDADWWPTGFNHFVFTYDGTTLKAYVNGSEVGSATVTGTMPATVAHAFFGRSRFDQSFVGSIAGAFISTSALSASEVVTEYKRVLGDEDYDVMEGICPRRVFTVATSFLGASDPEDLETDIEGLTLSSEVSSFDWSGMSLAVEQESAFPENPTTNSEPVTLISEKHGLASNHNKPPVGGVVYFRKTDGTVVTGTVAARTNISGDLSLIRFTDNPSADLARYPIGINEADYRGGNAWLPDQDFTLRLCYLSWVFDTVLSFGSTWWSDYLTTGSGRPALVATDDDELILLGTIYSGGTGASTTRPSQFITQINTLLTAQSDSNVTTFDLSALNPPAPDPPAEEAALWGTRSPVQACVRQRVQSGIQSFV